jgi:hypothetical protein
MKHMLALLVPAALAAATSAATATAAPSASAPPCIPKIAKIQGKTAAENCGPATVTIKIGGRSYAFKDGLCNSDGSTFILDLGTVVAGDRKHNLGLPTFGMTVSGHTADVTGMYGGKSIIPDSMTLATVKGAGSNKGSFSNRLSTPKFTGSWDCHGVIWKG